MVDLAADISNRVVRLRISPSVFGMFHNLSEWSVVGNEMEMSCTYAKEARLFSPRFRLFPVSDVFFPVIEGILVLIGTGKRLRFE